MSKAILALALGLGGLLMAACGPRSGNTKASEAYGTENNGLYMFDTLVAGQIAFHMETQPVDSGYGYVVAVNGRKMISQTVIPVLEGRHYFRTQEAAYRIGKLVLMKMTRSTDLPTVTMEDLMENGIVGPDGQVK